MAMSNIVAFTKETLSLLMKRSSTLDLLQISKLAQIFIVVLWHLVVILARYIQPWQEALVDVIGKSIGINVLTITQRGKSSSKCGSVYLGLTIKDS